MVPSADAFAVEEKNSPRRMREKIMVEKNHGSTVIELARNSAYLRQIESKYSTSHYYEVSVHCEVGLWTVKLACKALEVPLERNYHGRLFEDHIEEPRVFAALVNDEQVGWIELGYEKWNNRMRIWEFLVKQEHRGRGIGQMLMNHALKTAKEKGARMLVLETQTNNSEAIDFYLRFGFEFIGIDTAAYSNEDVLKKEVRLEMGMKL